MSSKNDVSLVLSIYFIHIQPQRWGRGKVILNPCAASFQSPLNIDWLAKSLGRGSFNSPSTIINVTSSSEDIEHVSGHHDSKAKPMMDVMERMNDYNVTLTPYLYTNKYKNLNKAKQYMALFCIIFSLYNCTWATWGIIYILHVQKPQISRLLKTCKFANLWR